MTSPAGILTAANELLAARYRTPRLGNKRHPVSELVFIILSARTRRSEHEAAYRRLRHHFVTWDRVRDVPVDELQHAIRKAGLSRIKAHQIKALLRQLTNDFGTLSGHALRTMQTPLLEQYLLSLPGVGLKTARCVMLYSLDRPVFPVDTHCMRLFYNLGLIPRRLRLDKAQDPLQSLVPATIRYSLHVNTVAHGRLTCIPAAPRCASCPIRVLCQYPFPNDPHD